MLFKYVENLLNFRPLVKKCPKELRRLHEMFVQTIAGLHHIGYDAHSFITVVLLVSKLDQESRELWEFESRRLYRIHDSGHTKDRKYVCPKLGDVLNFIDERARQLEHSVTTCKVGALVSPPKKHVSAVTTISDAAASEVTCNYVDQRRLLKPKPKFHPRKVQDKFVQKLPAKLEQKPSAIGGAQDSVVLAGCVCCGDRNHKLWNCAQFRELDWLQKRACVFKAHLCYNCLSSGHSVNQCPSSFTCKTCKERHHFLLHNEEKRENRS